MVFDFVVYACKAKGDSLRGDFSGCISITSGKISRRRLLRFHHEEDDDMILFHISHSICANNLSRIIFDVADTDIFASPLYHYLLSDLDA